MTTLETYLHNFGCDRYSTLDQIKTSFRKLALKAHPDQGGDAKAFIELKKQYEYILANHKPAPDPALLQHFFRILDKMRSNYVIPIPEQVLSKDTTIHFLQGLNEFNITLKAGVNLPLKIRINDKRVFKYPVEVEFVYQSTTL